MPRTCTRYHALPYWFGDSGLAIVACGRQRPGPDGDQFIDLNVQAAADGDMVLHWGTARKNGYTHIVNAVGVRRRMTEAELDRPLFLWKVAQIKRWRRTKRRGKSYESRVRPLEVGQATKLCAKNGVVPCFELKSERYARGIIADRVVRRVKSFKTRAYFMALSSMARCKGKAAAVTAAGGEFAVLARYPKPADLASWRHTRVWGSWRTR